MILRTGVLAAAITLSAYTVAVAADKPANDPNKPQQGQPAQPAQPAEPGLQPAVPAQPAQPAVRQGGGGGGKLDVKRVEQQLRQQGKGKKHDHAKFQRLMTLIRNPQQSVANLNRWAQAHQGGGAGMAPTMQQGTAAQQQPTTQHGTTAQQPSNTTTGTTAQQPTNTTTGQTAQQPTNTTTAGQTAATMGGAQTQSNVPSIQTTSVSTVVGGDSAAIGTFVQALSSNNLQILNLQNTLNNNNILLSALNDSSVLNNADLNVNAIVGVDVLQGTGGLEIYTIP